MLYCIAPHLTNNYSTTEQLNDLIEKIDHKILEMAVVQYNNVRFGFVQPVDIEKYEDLLIYKKILLDKLLGCNCLTDQFLLMIVSKLKKLIK
jgi:hypothetical protein